MECKIPLIMAYAMGGYGLASILYLVITIFTNIGTPLKDAINKNPTLKKIREQSRKKRAEIFLLSVGIAVLFLALTQPFKLCEEINQYQDIFISGYDL